MHCMSGKQWSPCFWRRGWRGIRVSASVCCLAGLPRMGLVGLTFHEQLTVDDILGDKNITFPQHLLSSKLQVKQDLPELI